MAVYPQLADKIEAVVFRFTHKQLSAAFNKWLEYHRECEAETRADVHYYGHLLDSAWLAWLQVRLSILKAAVSVDF